MDSPKRKLSASQVGVIMRCPREYAYKYILKYPDESTEALRMGTLFHSVVDGKTLLRSDFQGLDASKYPWADALRVMISGFNRIKGMIPGDIVSSETRLEMPGFLGFVDKVVVDPKGNWRLVEIKTTARLAPEKQAWIPRETQICAYVANRDIIADFLDLLPEQFAGVLYIHTIKPQERRLLAGKKRETDETIDEWGARLTSTTVIWDLPARLFAGARQVYETSFTLAGHLRDYFDQQFAVRNSVDDVPGNTASCIRYNKPCPYFNNCHQPAGGPDASATDQNA